MMPGTGSDPCTSGGAGGASAPGPRAASERLDGASREPRKRSLAGLVEQPLLFELCLQPLVFCLERADALRLDEVDVELKLAARLVERNAAVRGDGGAVCDEAGGRGLRAAAAGEEGAAD